MNVNISHNQVQNGIEISFDTKPEKEIINWLKYNKYRWNRVKQVWWKKYSNEDWDAAHKYFENPDSHKADILANQYIRRIRNANKKAYALAYQKWIKEGRKPEEEPEEKGLSTMAAQEVRMELNYIYKSKESLQPDNPERKMEELSSGSPEELVYFKKEDVPTNIKERFGISKTDDKEIIWTVPKEFFMTLPDGEKVYFVDGKYIRDHLYSDFAQGGNDCAYPEFIPIGEIWIEKALKDEFKPILHHEKNERDLMLNKGLSYDEAHDVVREKEDKEREKEAQKTLESGDIDFSKKEYKNPTEFALDYIAQKHLDDRNYPVYLVKDIQYGDYGQILHDIHRNKYSFEEFIDFANALKQVGFTGLIPDIVIDNLVKKVTSMVAEEKPKVEPEKPEAKEWKYILTVRPFDIGTQPKEGFVKAEQEEGNKYQTLTYNRKLTPEEIRHYDLVPITQINEIAGKEFVDKELMDDGTLNTLSIEWNKEKTSAKVSKFDEEGKLIDYEIVRVDQIIENIENGKWIEKKSKQENEPEKIESMKEITEEKAPEVKPKKYARLKMFYAGKNAGTIGEVVYRPNMFVSDILFDDGQKERIDNTYLEFLKDEPEKVDTEYIIEKITDLRMFASASQINALMHIIKGEENEAGLEILNRLTGIIDRMPKTYETENIPNDEKIVYLHYFKGGSDWYIVEKDKEPEQYQAFGYAILNGDYNMAKWGYINIVELIKNNVELDFYWEPKTFGEVKKILFPKLDELEEIEKQYYETPYVATKYEFGKSEKSGRTFATAISENPHHNLIKQYLLIALNRLGYTDASVSIAKSGSIYIYLYGIGSRTSIRISDHEGRGDIWTPTYDISTLKEAKDIIANLKPKAEVDKFEKEQREKENKEFDDLKAFENELKNDGKGYKIVKRTYQDANKFSQNKKIYAIRTTALGRNTMGEVAYQHEYITDYDSYCTMPSKEFIKWYKERDKAPMGSKKAYQEFLENLHELDGWVKYEFPKGEIREYRKLTLLPEYERNITDLAIKESMRDIEKGGKSYIEAIISLKEKGQEEEKRLIEQLYSEMIGKPETPEVITKPAKEPLDISYNITDYNNNAYEINKAIEKLLDKKWKEPLSEWTEEQLAFIKHYSGYGGLDEYGEITKGSLFEFYTPEFVIEKMWGLANHFHYKEGPVCEPSVGIGEFFNRKFVKKEINKTGYEINKYSARICKLLYPEANINDGEETKYFEQLFIKNNYTVRDKVKPAYELVIGNPPYGEAQSLYLGMGEKSYTHARNYIDYFIFRGLDLLVKDGLLIYIIGAEAKSGGVLWLDQDMNKCKEMIAQKGKLIDAYRLPEGIFERTNVISDIIVMRKK